MTSRMQAADYKHLLTIGAVIDQIREPAHDCPTELLVDQWVHLGGIAYALE